MDEKKNVIKLRDEDILSEETENLISSLPSDKDPTGKKLCKYQGCWYYPGRLQGVLNFQRDFEPQQTDIIVASYPKSGTTWVKALTFALVHRSKHRFHDHAHPLLSTNPHDLIPFFEINLYMHNQKPDLTKFSATTQRLFSTHMPLDSLQEGLKGTPCKIVYVCRNVKDTLVSVWHFFRRYQMDNEIQEGGTLEDTFESFCRGVTFFGPFWVQVLSYWRGSLEDNKQVLFLRYEEMKAEPHEQIKRLAEFLGCPFTEEEEESGSMDGILDLCSFRKLSSLEVNKTGKTDGGRDNKDFFRKGEVGDWKNHLTPEMENRIDMIIKEKLQGSDFEF